LGTGPGVAGAGTRLARRRAPPLPSRGAFLGATGTRLPCSRGLSDPGPFCWTPHPWEKWVSCLPLLHTRRPLDRDPDPQEVGEYLLAGTKERCGGAVGRTGVRMGSPLCGRYLSRASACRAGVGLPDSTGRERVGARLDDGGRLDHAWLVSTVAMLRGRGGRRHEG
jgi:hypothetical protein